MYVDPSRVQMAIRFARIAAGSAVEREAATDDLRVFLDALWADATAEGRSRYMTAAARAPGGLPWAAVILPDGPGMAVGGMPALAGPAVVELIVGQADPDDEGVAGFRLSDGDSRATRLIEALYSWDLAPVERAASGGGWRLEAVEEPGELRVVRGGDDGQVDETAEVELPAADETTGWQRWMPWVKGVGLAAGAGAAVGVIGMALVGRKEGK